MNERLKIIFSHVKKTPSLADVGCDHGYLAKACLDRNVAGSVIISDVSLKSLEKAKALLKDYSDRVVSVCCDGFSGYPYIPETAVIAGMGGEEIIHVLLESKKIPKNLVLAPQKNSDKVRRTLISLGYLIEKDFTFFSSSKYYDLIVATVGKDEYSENEYLFGRDNLKEKSTAFLNRLQLEVNMLNAIISNADASESAKLDAQTRLNKIKEIL